MNQRQHQQHQQHQDNQQNQDNQQQTIPSFSPWMLSPQQSIAFVLTPINTLSFNHNHNQNNNDNNNNNKNITSSFPLNLPPLTVNHGDPDLNGSNTPETIITDVQSIISETNQTIASSISPNIITPFNLSSISLKNNKKKNECSSSFGINDTDDISTKQSQYEQSPIHHEPESEPISEDDDDDESEDDDDLYIPSENENYRKTRKHKKSRKKSRKSQKSRSSQSIQCVEPECDGDGSISWSDLCRIDFECHICNKRYIGSSARRKYVECLKTHYQSKDNDLEYLKCELCLKNPTQKAEQLRTANKVERGSIDYDPDKWRRSSHIANFVSHLAGHPENEPGFHCKVKIYDQKTDKFIVCTAAASTPQNLAKHIYGMHYEAVDTEKKYTITAGKGYVLRNRSKQKQTKQIKAKKRKTYYRKRKLSKIIKQKKEEDIKEPDYKRQKLNTGNKKESSQNVLPPKPSPPVRSPRTFDNDDNLSLLLPESVGKRCYSISDQNLFLTKLVTAATLNLDDLDGLNGLFEGKTLEN